MSNGRNIDTKVTRDFGKEWSRFDQSKLSADELEEWFLAYFAIFPLGKIAAKCDRLRLRLWKWKMGEAGCAASWKTSLHRAESAGLKRGKKESGRIRQLSVP